MNEIRFDKLYATDREKEPCTLAIPFAEGTFFMDQSVQIRQNGQPVLQQSKVTSTYKDGSIRYLFTRFLADIPANKGCRLEYDILEKPHERSVSDLTVAVNMDSISVSNASIQFTVKNHSTSLFEEFHDSQNHYGKEHFIGPVFSTNDSPSTSYQVCYDTWKVVEEGPVCVILSNVGHASFNGLDGGFPFETRITAYTQKPWVEVAFRIFNATNKVQNITGYQFQIKLTDDSQKNSVGISNYRTSIETKEDGETVSKEITAEFLKGQGNEHFAESLYGTFFADCTNKSGGICATVFQAQQNFPKALVASKSGISIFLVPDHGSITMQPGMAREQRILLHFHDASASMEELDNRSLIYQMPDHPVISSSTFEISGTMADIFVQNKDLDVEDALISCADGHARAYGMMNWGDAPDANYTSQGRGHGRPVWVNNEYDFPHAAFLLYAKTGIRRFYDYGVVAATHQMDVDVCHYSDNPLLIGGQWEHTHGHCVEGVMACSHEWVEGVLDCYHFTGDERFYETALGIGENVLRLLDTPMYQKSGSFGARETGWALRSLTALYVETHDEKWLQKSEGIIRQFKEWSENFGGWLAPYTDNTLIRVPFMISVAIGSLMRYYRVMPRDDLKELILTAVDDMIENCLAENGLFFYKELPSLQRSGTNPLTLEALAIAYELSGNPTYLTHGFRTFKKVLSKIDSGYNGEKKIVEDALVVGNQSTKTFAQAFIPIATYYKALERANLLNNL